MTQWNGSANGSVLATQHVDDGRTDADPLAPPRYDMIELMFFAYRDFVEDADRVLARDGFGRAHHRVLYFAARRPGLTIAELLDILKITKQSLNRVLKALLDRGFVAMRLGEADRRQRLLFATARGTALIEKIAAIQSSRLERAFAQLGPGAAEQAAAFLAAMTGAPTPLGEALEAALGEMPLARLGARPSHTSGVSTEGS